MTSNFLDFVQANIKYFIGAGILALNIISFYNYYSNKNNTNNNNNINNNNNNNTLGDSSPRDHPFRIKKIIIYPIKSCKGIEVRSCKIDKYGFENDRRFMLIHQGRFMSQRTTPKMALIEPDISEDGQYLIINAKGQNEIRVKIGDTNGKEIIKVGIWKDTVDVVDCGDQVSEWLTKFLETEARLVTIAPSGEYHRRVPEDYIDHIIEEPTETDRDNYQFALCDTSQVMILSESSIDDINMHIDATRKEKKEKPRDPVTFSNFRPNILVSGYDCSPFEEDRWEQIRISGLLLSRVAFTPRCKLTTVQPQTGILDPYGDNEPLRTMETYRKFNGKLLFGALFVHSNPIVDDEELFVGNIIDVLKINNKPYEK
ncbi:hypothetical protein ACTFIW_012298 [Dictyostelium discoideum]